LARSGDIFQRDARQGAEDHADIHGGRGADHGQLPLGMGNALIGDGREQDWAGVTAAEQIALGGGLTQIGQDARDETNAIKGIPIFDQRQMIAAAFLQMRPARCGKMLRSIALIIGQ